MRVLLLLATLVATPALAVIPAATPFVALDAGRAPAVTDVLYEREFSVSEGNTLQVDLGSEAVVVETGSGTRASVRVEGTGSRARDEFERRRFSATYSGGRLTVRTQPERHRFGRSSSASFTVTIRVPERFHVNVDVGSGSVRVGDVHGDVLVDTGSGSVTLGDVSGGRVSVDTGSGSVRAGRLSGGSVSVDTGSGSVALESVGGPLTVDTGSGSVAVAMSRMAEAEISTGSGSVTLRLPAGADAELVADGSRVEIDDRLAFVGRRDRDEARGRLGRGGPRLAIDTGSGAIRIDAR